MQFYHTTQCHRCRKSWGSVQLASSWSESWPWWGRCSGLACATACSSCCQYPATLHCHWRGVGRHSTGHNQLYVKEMCCTAWGKWWSRQMLTFLNPWNLPDKTAHFRPIVYIEKVFDFFISSHEKWEWKQKCCVYIFVQCICLCYYYSIDQNKPLTIKHLISLRRFVKWILRSAYPFGKGSPGF